MNEHSSRSHAIFIITIECSKVIMSFITREKCIYFFKKNCLLIIIEEVNLPNTFRKGTVL